MLFRSRNVYEKRKTAYSFLETTKILLAAHGPICHALSREAVNASCLIEQSKIPKQTKFEWSHTDSPKRWVSVVYNDGEWQVKKKRRRRCWGGNGGEAGLL